MTVADTILDKAAVDAGMAPAQAQASPGPLPAPIMAPPPPPPEPPLAPDDLKAIEDMICPMIGPQWSLTDAERQRLTSRLGKAYPGCSLGGYEKPIFWIVLASIIIPRLTFTVKMLLEASKRDRSSDAVQGRVSSDPRKEGIGKDDSGAVGGGIQEIGTPH